MQNSGYAVVVQNRDNAVAGRLPVNRKRFKNPIAQSPLQIYGTPVLSASSADQSRQFEFRKGIADHRLTRFKSVPLSPKRFPESKTQFDLNGVEARAGFFLPSVKIVVKRVKAYLSDKRSAVLKYHRPLCPGCMPHKNGKLRVGGGLLPCSWPPNLATGIHLTMQSLHIVSGKTANKQPLRFDSFPGHSNFLFSPALLPSGEPRYVRLCRVQQQNW